MGPNLTACGSHSKLKGGESTMMNSSNKPSKRFQMGHLWPGRPRGQTWQKAWGLFPVLLDHISF